MMHVSSFPHTRVNSAKAPRRLGTIRMPVIKNKLTRFIWQCRVLKLYSACLLSFRDDNFYVLTELFCLETLTNPDICLVIFWSAARTSVAETGQI